MKKVLITGGSGLLGLEVTNLLLSRSYMVRHLSTRKSYKPPKGVSAFYWNPAEAYMDEFAIDDVDVVIHLAGAGVADKRWTSERKRVILESRVKSTKLLMTKIQNSSVKQIIGASAIGYYGSKGERVLNEGEEVGNDFLASVCESWEKEYLLTQDSDLRKTIFRIGIVLARNGGAFKEMIQTLPFFIGILGNGKQIYSWIHIKDLASMFIHAIENEIIHGVYNAVASIPVPQKTIAKKIARLKNTVVVPTPEFALKIALGEMSQVVLMSQNCSANKIIESGYKFKYPEIQDALSDLFS